MNGYLLVLGLWLTQPTPAPLPSVMERAPDATELAMAVSRDGPGHNDRRVALAPPDDHWFAEDKLRHGTASFAATSLAYGAASAAELGHDDAALVAAGLAVAAGIWKEIRDERIGTGWSAKDLVWDALGVALGVLWVREIQ